MGISEINTNKAVFLDRDGVINKPIVRDGKAFSPRSKDEFKFIDGVAQAVKSFKDADLTVIVVTNQPDIARNRLSWSDLEWMTKKVMTETLVDDVLVCPHDDYDNCHCRKPKPGMLLDAAAKWNIDLSRSYMIGDSWKDIEAGENAGCCSILIDAVYNQEVFCDFQVKNLTDAANLIIRKGV